MMEKKTVWTEGIQPFQTKEIPDHLETDILIIGGGLAGISTLFELRHHKDKITLIEQDKIGFGKTSKSTGKLTFMQGLCYQKLEKIYQFDLARLYYESQKEAIRHVKHNVESLGIDCGFEETEACVFTKEEKELSKFEKERNFYHKIKVENLQTKSLPFDIPYIYALKTSGSAVFNPVRYLYHLAKTALESGVNLFEEVRAQTITKIGEQYQVITNKGSILANKVIVTTHYPFFVNPGFIPLKSHIEHSFVTATKVKKTKAVQAINEETPTHSFRYYNGDESYFIYAGDSYISSNHFDIKLRKEEIENRLHTKPNYIFHTHDIIPDDSIPFIGRVNKHHPNLFIATGFNKWGMTNSVIASILISDLVEGKESKYEKLFLPSRPINFEKFKNFFVDGYLSGKSILKAKLIRNQVFYQENIAITYEDGKRVGIYMDEQGKIHKVRNLCPHMKCNLIFNTLDKTWDCPCHGSRFDIDGNVISGPSVYDIKL